MGALPLFLFLKHNLYSSLNVWINLTVTQKLRQEGSVLIAHMQWTETTYFVGHRALQTQGQQIVMKMQWDRNGPFCFVEYHLSSADRGSPFPLLGKSVLSNCARGQVQLVILGCISTNTYRPEAPSRIKYLKGRGGVGWVDIKSKVS